MPLLPRTLILTVTLTLKITVIYVVQLPNVRRKQRIPMTSRVNVFRSQMCGQTLLFIIIANGVIVTATSSETFKDSISQ